jgi:protein PhnA
MSKGFEKNKERKDKLSLFGKELTRRSGAKCELCGTKGVKLEIYELPPIDQEPEFAKCIFLCEKCLSQTKCPEDTNHLRCLANSIWSEVPAVVALSVILLSELKDKTDYAGELLEQVYLDEEVQNLL